MPNSALILTQIANFHSTPTGYTSACAPAEPISQSGVFRERFPDSGEYRGADRLLLATQVVLK
jgi:hypothetical protein